MIDPRSLPERAGVREGDTVQLMADLTRMAWSARKAGQRFSASAFLDAFVAAVGPSGTVLVPTFNFDLESGDVFDQRTTRSISGALAHAALEHASFRRTRNPLHSFAVAGALRHELTQRDQRDSFGADSPFAFLLERQGSLLAFDLPLNDALTFTHFVEQRVGVPYRRQRTIELQVTDADGRTASGSVSLYAKKPGYEMRFTALEPLLTAANAWKQGELGGSSYFKVDLAMAYQVIERDIRDNGARSIQRFTLSLWMRDRMKAALRTFGIRTTRDRMAHAARTP